MQMIALSFDMVIVGCNCGADYVFVIRLLLSDTSTHHWTSSHDQYKLFHSPFISRPDTLPLPPSTVIVVRGEQWLPDTSKLICKRQNIKSPLLVRRSFCLQWCEGSEAKQDDAWLYLKQGHFSPWSIKLFSHFLWRGWLPSITGWGPDCVPEMDADSGPAGQ